METQKARFVVQVHCDALKGSLVYDIHVARQHKNKILVGITAVFAFFKRY